MKLLMLVEDASCHKCDNCIAACCRCHDRIHVVTEDKTPRELCDHGQNYDSMKLVEDKECGGRRCIALDPKTNRCTIYEDRPSVCRDFEEGGPHCRYIRNHLLRD